MMNNCFIRLVVSALLFIWVNSVYAQGPGAINGYISQQVANQVSRTVSSNISKNLTDRILMPQLKIRNESGEVKDFSISPDSRFFTLLHDDNTVRVWDARQGIQRPIISLKGQSITKAISVSLLNITLLAKEDGVIDVYNVYTGKKVNQLLSLDEEIISLSLSQDEVVLIAAHENGDVIIWDLRKLTKIKTIKTSYDDELKFVKIEQSGKSFIAAGEDGFVDRWSIEKGEKIASLPKHTDDVIGLWVGNNYGDVVSIDDDNIFQRSDINNDNRLKKKIDADVNKIALSEDLKLLAIATEDSGIKIVDANGMQMLKIIKLNKEVSYIQFINQGKHLITTDKKGILQLFSVSDAKELMKLISTETGWTIVDNIGRFDSSEKGMLNVSWEVAEEYEIPLDNFSEAHYEPGLLANHIEGQEFINKTPLVVTKGIRLPPQIVISIPKGNQNTAKAIIVSVEAQGLGNGVKNVNLYHNGKVVDAGTVINTQQETVDQLIKKTVDFSVNPTVGKNTFKVIATNNMGIEGHSEELSLDFEGKKQKSTLHILTVGVNKYRDSRLNLDYSVADAAEISNVFKKSQLAVYDDMVHHQLRDNEATKKGILNQLNKINNYSQNDVMVLYLAGHGLAVEGEWFYLPHETMLQDNQNYYTQVGVSAKEIQKILTNSKVQHVMVMIDACYSGAGLKAFRKLQDTQRHFSRALSKSVGVVVLAATRQDQEAAELSDLGHGLFTYVVSDGMSGKADFKPKNSKISAHEVADFSTETIPTFSKKYLGAAQEPTSFTMGSDFVLLRK